MELLNQFDVANPDHVSVITRNNKVIISISKDGTDVTIGIPTRTSGIIFDSTPRPPLQQPAPQVKAVKEEKA
jgi:hypothetical protein